MGQYQTASSGYPHAAWTAVPPPVRRAPHWVSNRSGPASSRPASAELVDEALRSLRVRLGDHQTLLGELPQAAGQDVRRDPGDLALQLPEPLGARQQGGHDQERPAIADRGQRLGQGRGRERLGLLADGRLLAVGSGAPRALGLAAWWAWAG